MSEQKKKPFLDRNTLIFLAVIGVIYGFGLQAEVFGTLQRAILFTGIMQPDTELEEGTIYETADYNFELVDLAGNNVSFSDFQGKTIFLNFWATWCPPCVAEMPGIESLYQSLQNNPAIVFILISTDDDREKARAFLKRKTYTMPVYFLKGGIPSVFSSRSIPTTYVISPDQKVVMKKNGMADYDTEDFKTFLKELQ